MCTSLITTLLAPQYMYGSSPSQVPEFRVSYQIQTDKLDEMYKRLKSKGVTMTALLAKACAVALQQHPVLYSSE